MEKAKVFVIMPFQAEFFEVYEMLKMQFSELFDFSNAGDEGNQQNILQDIFKPIYEADIIIADLTGLNSNVLYELGVAHSFNKKTIVITQDDISKLPFDLKQYRAKDYNTHFKKFAELVEYLNINLKGAISGDIVYSNPVKDFLSFQKVDFSDLFSPKIKSIPNDDSEKGFLDFLSDIEESTKALTEKITDMTNDMTIMSDGVAKSGKEIERVNRNGGSAVFVRKETKRAAKHVETFSTKLRVYNTDFTALWNEVEKNILGLLENKFSGQAENKEHLVNYIKSLKGMQIAITESNKSVSELRTSMKNNLGIERSMNQAINFIVDDLATYITITEQMHSSIDRIIEKSKFVVGAIDFDTDTSDADGSEIKVVEQTMIKQ